MRSNKFKAILMSVLATVMVIGTFTQSASAATKEELQAKFEKRFPQILAYKTQSKVGETMEGYLEAVKKDYLDDKTLSKLIDEENADRKELYGIIAKDEKTTAEQVANTAAKRNYDKARAGDYLKGNDGQWHKKS